MSHALPVHIPISARAAALGLAVGAALVLAAAPLSAQPADTLRGTVRDASGGEPLVGATVRFHAADPAAGSEARGAVADADGAFRILLPPGAAGSIEARYVGYKPATLPIGPADREVAIEMESAEVMREMVEVTATRRTRSVEDACCRVESIREEVQQHAPFAPGAVDVMSRYSSCTSTRISCSVDDASSIRLRGLEPTYVMTLMDGIPAFSGLGTFYGLSLIPAHALQTIQISEGASSAFHGNGAISGVVALQTRQPTELPELLLSGNLAGHAGPRPSAGDLNASYTGMAGDVGLALFGSYNRHGSDHGEESVLRRYERVVGLAKGNMMIDDASELTLAVLGAGESRRGTVRAPLDATESVDVGRFDLWMKGARTLGERSELLVSALGSMTTVRRGDASMPDIDALQKIAYGSVVWSGGFGDHDLSVGAELRDDRLTERSSGQIDYAITLPSLFLQEEYQLAERWRLLGSLRADHHPTAGTILSPRGSLRYEPVENMTMRLMAGRGFKGEALFDREHATLHGIYRWHPNPELAYERSFTLNYDVSYSFLMGDAAGMDANFNAYHTTIAGKAIPQADSLAAGTLMYVNSDRPARLAGIELQLRPTLGDHWSGSLALAAISYALQRTDGVYEQMPLAPQFNLDASLMYRDDESGVILESWGSWIGAQHLPANPAGLAESPSYVMMNARAEKTFGIISLYVGATNLLDVVQEQTMPILWASGQGALESGAIWGPLEGREVFAGVRLRIAEEN